MTVALIGTGLLILSIVLESLFISIAVAFLGRVGEELGHLPMIVRTTVLLSGLAVWLMLGTACVLSMWAGFLIGLGEFDEFARALYFTSVSATTLGYGDILLSEQWQLLSGFLAANGLILFSLNTALLFEALRRVNQE